MQTLSHMRRNSTYYQALKGVGLFLTGLVYASVSSMWIWSSPLLGIAFYYIITHIESKKSYFNIGLLFLYSIFVEIDRALIPFSFVLFIFIFYKVLFESFKKNIYCQNCLVPIYIITGYTGYYLFNLFLSYIFDLQSPVFGINYLYYIITDIILVYIFL